MTTNDHMPETGTHRSLLLADELAGVDFTPVRKESAPMPAKTKMKKAANQKESGDAAAQLEALRIEHDAECPHCTVAEGHTRTVFGEGDPNARLMFIGEAPGEEEDRTGRPFVGRAGQKLEEMIIAMGLSRAQVYIGNVLKSRPPNNRTPLAHEVEACAPYLMRQIRIIKPEVIVTLGNPSTKFMLKTDVGITRMRGQWAQFVDGDLTVAVMPTFHPAYLLRNYTAQTRGQVWSDLQAVMERLGLSAG
jgi:uracil-DNA glycosylase family 4